jgi:hypothetical protein
MLALLRRFIAHRPGLGCSFWSLVEDCGSPFDGENQVDVEVVTHTSSIIGLISGANQLKQKKSEDTNSGFCAIQNGESPKIQPQD